MRTRSGAAKWLVGLGLALCLGVALRGYTAPQAKIADVEDWTAEARRMSSETYAQPTTQFAFGTANPRPLSPKQVEQKTNGFVITLPNGAPIPSPAVHEGVLVTSGGFHSHEIYGFDAKTGKPLWGLGLSDDGPSAPACAQGICVWNTESCTIFAVEVRTGKLLWAYYLGDPQLSAPAIGGSSVFTTYPAALPNQPPGATHVLASFELRTGKLRWQRWIDGDAISSPVVAEQEVHLSSMAGTVYRFRESDGEVLSARRSRATSAPTVSNGEIYFAKRADDAASAKPEESLAKRDKHARREGFDVSRKAAPYLDPEVQRASDHATKGKSLDAANGFGNGAPESAKAAIAEANIGQGNVSTLQSFQGSRILKLGKRSIATMGDELVASDGETGRTQWKVKLSGDLARSGGALAAPPAAAGKYVVLGTLGGEIQLIDPESGKLERSFAAGSPIRSQPVIEGGFIYVGTDDGRLVAIQTGDASLTGWSQWGRDAARSGTRD